MKAGAEGAHCVPDKSDQHVMLIASRRRFGRL